MESIGWFRIALGLLALGIGLFGLGCSIYWFGYSRGVKKADKILDEIQKQILERHSED
ncbi:MAG: hypothetical protein ACP5SH_18245 [Syntrophobacteraceae bacterium]